jgi:hypothetical protein
VPWTAFAITGRKNPKHPSAKISIPPKTAKNHLQRPTPGGPFSFTQGMLQMLNRQR